MEKAEYIDIILIGYFKEREYFKQYLIRQFKIAESEHIEEHEFFSKCLDVVQLIAGKLNEIPKMEGVYNFKIPLTYFSKKFNKGHIDWDDLKEITLRIKEAKDSIIIIEEPQLIKTKNPDEVKRKKELKDFLWFKIGLLFATGKIFDLLKQFNNNATDTAKYLKNESYRPFISESIGVSKKTSTQSIYNRKKFILIYNHCKENGIKITDDFENYYKEIELNLD